MSAQNITIVDLRNTLPNLKFLYAVAGAGNTPMYALHLLFSLTSTS